METSIGLGHTMLRTTCESFGERQPAGLEGRFWITADARLDDRAELLAELHRPSNGILPSVPDSELILRAYAKWGPACVEHLRGDFSFAIWDARDKQLFCARDQFGIKPFYFASVGSILIFSNTLDCIRQHPAVSARLNDLAIADFLFFDMIREPAATSFADIQQAACPLIPSCATETASPFAVTGRYRQETPSTTNTPASVSSNSGNCSIALSPTG